MSKNALLILADGFEEIEAISVIDILRRAGISLKIAGLTQLEVKSARKMIIMADALLQDVLSENFEMIILPGGEPGTTNLENSKKVAELLKNQVVENKGIAAICAAPRILDQLSLLDGKHATSFPGTKPKMTRCDYVEKDVVVDGKIITSRGPGTAMAFAYEIVDHFNGPKTSDSLKETMLYRHPR